MADQSQAFVSMANQLLEDGYIEIDENGDAQLTEKGKQRTAKRLDKLPWGDEILLDIAFCESHGIPVSLF